MTCKEKITSATTVIGLASLGKRVNPAHRSSIISTLQMVNGIFLQRAWLFGDPSDAKVTLTNRTRRTLLRNTTAGLRLHDCYRIYSQPTGSSLAIAVAVLEPSPAEMIECLRIKFMQPSAYFRGCNGLQAVPSGSDSALTILLSWCL